MTECLQAKMDTNQGNIIAKIKSHQERMKANINAWLEN
jgi:hypothetical protein